MVADRKMYESEVNHTRKLEAEIKRLRAALEHTLPVLAAAAAGASTQIAAGDIYRETRAALAPH